MNSLVYQNGLKLTEQVSNKTASSWIIKLSKSDVVMYNRHFWPQ